MKDSVVWQWSRGEEQHGGRGRAGKEEEEVSSVLLAVFKDLRTRNTNKTKEFPFVKER